MRVHESPWWGIGTGPSVDGQVFRHFFDKVNPTRPLWALGTPKSGARRRRIRRDADRRPLLRAELDAAFFHLYGLSREDTDYVLESFPIVKKNDEKKYGEYRTKRLILDRYEALAVASRTGKYESPLDPPPAHKSLRHPPLK